MPKIAHELSPAAVRRLLERPGVHAVGGLVVQVTERGARSWLLRVTIDGRRRELGLGSFPTVPLAAARELAREHRAKIAAGVDPIAEKKKARADRIAARAGAVTFK